GEEGLGARRRGVLGPADIGLVGYECPEKAGMPLIEDAVVQVCDPQTGEPLPYGQIGELVATVHNTTYPMLRFGTGDLSIIDDARCPCGRTSARMLGWRGRADEATKVRGMVIHPRPSGDVFAPASALP